jgi:D-lactate dehydrogenase
MPYVSLDALLAESDVVSLNCPLNAHTRNLLDTPQFARMKKGAILINTARGGVVSTEALLEALETGHLGGACLDVYDREKGLFFYDHRTTTLTDQNYARLRSFKNVLITGHQAFLTREALQGITEATMANLSEWKQQGIATNEVEA